MPIDFQCLSRKRSDVPNNYIAWDPGWAQASLEDIFNDWWTNLEHGVAVGDKSTPYATLVDYAHALGCLTPVTLSSTTQSGGQPTVGTAATTPDAAAAKPGGFNFGRTVKEFFETDATGASIALGVAAFVGYKFLSRD